MLEFGLENAYLIKITDAILRRLPVVCARKAGFIFMISFTLNLFFQLLKLWVNNVSIYLIFTAWPINKYYRYYTHSQGSTISWSSSLNMYAWPLHNCMITVIV